MSQRRFQLGVALIFTLLSVGVMVIPWGWSPIHALVAVLLILFLPGHALQLAVLPWQPGHYDRKLMVAIGLSIAITAVVGLMLNWTRWGLTPTTWAIALGGTTAGIIVAAWILSRDSESETHSLPTVNIGRKQGYMFVAAALLAATAIVVARRGATQQYDNENVIQFWLVPEPTSPETANLGINNLERNTILLDVHVVQGTNTLATWTLITLRPGEQWVRTVALSPTLPRDVPIKATLYKHSAPTIPFRSVSWWPATGT